MTFAHKPILRAAGNFILSQRFRLRHQSTLQAAAQSNKAPLQHHDGRMLRVLSSNDTSVHSAMLAAPGWFHRRHVNDRCVF